METFSIGYALLGIQRALLDVVTPELRAVVVDFDKNTPQLYVRFYFDGEISEEIFDLWACAITEASAGLGPDCLIDDGIEQLDYPQKIPLKGRYAFLRKEDKSTKDIRQLNESHITYQNLSEKIKTFSECGMKIKIESSGSPRYIELIDFKEFIGDSVNRITGNKMKTSWGIIHYELDGIHIIPAFHGNLKNLNKNSPISYALLAMQHALLGVVTPELRAVIVDWCGEKQFSYIRMYYHGEIPKELANLWEEAISVICADLGSGSLFDAKIERIDFPNKMPFRGRYAYLRND